MANMNSRSLVFPHVRVVEASAGSGKTYALAKRYVQLLINPTLRHDDIPIKNILAITFTNKAAAQMKARILDLLKKIALDRFSDTEEKEGIISALGVDFATAQKKALRITDELIANYNFFQVQTIHSFVNAILSTCALKLGLSASFRIRTDAAAYMAYSLDNLIDAAATDKDVRKDFSSFLKQYLLFENRTGWFPKSDILETVYGLFNRLNQTVGDLVPSRIDANMLSDGKKDLLLKMRQLKDNWPSGANKSFEKSFFGFLGSTIDNFDYSQLSAFLARQDFPLNKSGEISAIAQKLWIEIRGGLAVLAEAESAVLIDPYLAIFTRAMEYFRALSAKDDVLFLDELDRKTRSLFNEEGMTVPELYYRLAMRIKHILIDEFQDTSPIEWANLYPMVQEALSTDGSLFYVGDKKQAIYRFKGGDATLFDAVKGSFKGTDLITEFLTQNRRSQKEIVSFVNNVFSPDNIRLFLQKCREMKKDSLGLASADEEAVLNVFEGAKQDYTKGRDDGFVRLEIVETENKEDKNIKVKQKFLDLVDEVSRKHNYGDIAVLVRKNEEAQLLTEWLVEKGMPVESERSLNIRNNAYIKEVVSLLKFLNSPIDNLAFASFVTGDIFLSASGLKKPDIHDFIFSLRQKRGREKTVYLYREFRRKYPKVWGDFFEEFFKSVGFVPLYELVVNILHRFNCPANFHDAQGFFMRFLELVKEQEEEKGSLSLFLEFFDEAQGEELYCHVAGADAVKVLTIHKAKGLEFGVVVLPFLEMNVEVGPMAASFEEGRTVLRRLHKKYRMFSQKLDAIYGREYLKSFIDELNCIYVALTRARAELYIVLPKSAKRNSYAAELFGCDGRIEMGSLTPCAKKTGIRKERSVLELPPSSYVDWIGFLGRSMQGEFNAARLLKNRKKLLFGEACHYFLSFVGDLSRQDKGSVLKEAFGKAQNRFPDILDIEDCKGILERFSGDKSFSPFFLLKEAVVFQEVELADRSGNIKRIDRLIVGKDEVFVLDYKTSLEKSDSDKEQVQEYVSLIRELYPGKKAAGFLIYLDDFSLEKVS
jgi:ATP-dependent exoDNAse (exonuclease V) beta subunit